MSEKHSRRKSKDAPKKGKELGSSSKTKTKSKASAEKKPPRTTTTNGKHKEDSSTRASKTAPKPKKESKIPSSRKVAPTRNEIKVPPVTVVQEPVEEYADDFEEYESDFEADEDEGVMGEVEVKENVAEPVPPLVEEESLLMRRIAQRTSTAGSAATERQGTPLASASSPLPPRARVPSAQREIRFTETPTNDTNTNRAPPSVNGPDEHGLLPARVEESEEQQLQRLKSSKYYDYFLQLTNADGKRKLVHTQTAEDNLIAGSQTEEPIRVDATTQHPAPPPEPSPAANNTNSQKYNERFLKFVHISARLFENLIALENSTAAEAEGVVNSDIEMEHNSNLFFSSRYSQFEFSSILRDCRVCCLGVGPRSGVGGKFVVGLYLGNSPPSSSNASLPNKGSIILEFDLNSPSAPTRIFRCENELTACAYSTDGISALFGGLRDGSCVVWDLREAEGVRARKRIRWLDRSLEIAIRSPCYDTSFMAVESGSGGKFSITYGQLEAAIIAIAVSQFASGEKSDYYTEAPLQVTTLSERGTLVFWTALDSYGRQSEQEMGMAPGGKMKLVRLSSHQCFSGQGRSATCMEKLPNAEAVLVGTSHGCILKVRRGDRSSSRSETGPRKYWTNRDLSDEIARLNVSPLDGEVFAAAAGTRIYLFHLSEPAPLRMLDPAEMNIGDPLSQANSQAHIEWSPSAVHILYSIHGGQKLLVWDLERMASGEGNSGVEVCDLHHQSNVAATAVWKDGRGSAYMAFGLSAGQVMVHCLEKILRRHGSDNKKSLSQIIANT